MRTTLRILTLFLMVCTGIGMAALPDAQAFKFTWESRRPSCAFASMSAITYGNGKFVAVGYPGCGGNLCDIETSPDGITWTQQVCPANSNDPWLQGVAYGVVNGSDKYVAVGGGGHLVTSDDAVTWTQRTITPFSPNAVAYGDGKFVVVGASGGAMVSSDGGVTWGGTSGWLPQRGLYGVAYGNGKFVAVGQYNNDSYGRSVIFYSSDGTNWTPVNWAQAGIGNQPYVNLKGVGYGQNKGFVATGNWLLYSTDGQTWTIQVPPGGSGYAAAYGYDTFIHVGPNLLPYRSTDGLNWTADWFSSSGTFFGIAFGSESFVAVGGTNLYRSQPLKLLSVVKDAQGTTGSGTVTSSPSGISCGSTCSYYYSPGIVVTLTATADSGSSFGGWSGCDSVDGTTCTVTIPETGETTVTATFTSTTCANKAVRIARTRQQYDTLQDAYNNAQDGDVIQARLALMGSLQANRAISVTLNGGFNCAFSSNAGYATTLTGSIQTTEGSGTLTIGNFNLTN